MIQEKPGIIKRLRKEISEDEELGAHAENIFINNALKLFGIGNPEVFQNLESK